MKRLFMFMLYELMFTHYELVFKRLELMFMHRKHKILSFVYAVRGWRLTWSPKSCHP